MKNFLLSFFLLGNVVLCAQGTWGPDNLSKNKSNIYLELSGGAMVPSMLYIDNAFQTFQSDYFFGQTEGLGLRLQMNNLLSIGAQLSYRSQGVSFKELNSYKLQANYLNLLVPVEFDLKIASRKNAIKPNVFFFAGPYLAYSLGGMIETNELEIKLSANEIGQWDIGTEFGIGCRIPTFSMDGKSFLNLKASYYRSITNNYPDQISGYDVNQMEALLLSTAGARLNQGFKLTLTYELSLQKHKMTTITAGGNGKKTYKRYVNVK